MNRTLKLILLFLFITAAAALSVLCFINTDILNGLYKTIVYSALGAVYAGFIIAFLFKKTSLFRFFITLLLLALFISALFLLLDKSGFWDNISTLESMEQFIKSKGIFSGLVFILIQFLQVVAIPIPGVVTVSAGTILFGPVWGSALSYIGILCGTLLAFLIGRKFGYKLVVWIAGEEQLKKALVLIRGKDKVMFAIIFLLPFFPDDILCFVAGLTTMSFAYFTLMAMSTRVVTILVTVFFTEFLKSLFFSGSLIGYIILAVLAVVLTAVFIVSVKYGDKIQSFFEARFKKIKRNKDIEIKGEE